LSGNYQFPVYKIEIWEPAGASALYTFTSNVPSIHIKEIVTDGIGYFNFTLKTKLGTNYSYNDIDLHDIVKIWLAYGTVPTDPIFVGRVGNISAPMGTSQGYGRAISGLGQGEVLLNRLKKNKMWTATDATTIVSSFATDLSLGTSYTGDASDSTHVTMEVATKNYFELMQEISDWYDAGNSIKKDFYVDIGDVGHTTGHLVWKTRPFRTTGVSTLTVGTNIIDYNVTRQKEPVKNSILVYGKAILMYPELQDEWTDDYGGVIHPNWSFTQGTALTLEAGDNKVGSHYVKLTGDKDLVALHTLATLKFEFPENINQSKHGQYDTIALYARTPIIAPGNPFTIRLHTDAANYFETIYNKATTTDWEYLEFPLGYTQTYSEDFPNGIWTANGAPEWIDLDYAVFYQEWDNQDETSSIRIDDLWFKPRRPRSTPDPLTDAASIAAYGQRDLEVVDERMRTNAECTSRAQALLWQKKDAPIQIDITVIGDTNLLVGDRLSMTIPAENISASNYDVISVEHFMAKDFTSKATMVNSGNIRAPIENNVTRSLIRHNKAIRSMSTERTNIG
jgi:hypothetical protein